MVGPFGTDYLGNEANSKNEWKYASVIGILMYIVINSSIDITFSVNQCVRFTHNFKYSHEKDILHIFKYLKGNSKNVKHKRLIIYPSKNIQVECYVGADFSRMYSHRYHQDLVCV